MRITEVRLGRISVPLRVPFKTALRRVDSVEDVIVEVRTDVGAVGYGEAPPTGVITGDTTGSILGAIRDHIAKAILGREVDDFEDLMQAVQRSVVKTPVPRPPWTWPSGIFTASFMISRCISSWARAQTDHYGYHHQRQSAGGDGPGCAGRRPPGL